MFFPLSQEVTEKELLDVWPLTACFENIDRDNRITCKPHYVVSWCELGVWACILEVNGQVLKHWQRELHHLRTSRPHYVVSWCELGLWAGIIKANGQVLKTLTERTAPLEDLKTSLCRLLVWIGILEVNRQVNERDLDIMSWNDDVSDQFCICWSCVAHVMVSR